MSTLRVGLHRIAKNLQDQLPLFIRYLKIYPAARSKSKPEKAKPTTDSLKLQIVVAPD